MIGPLSARRLGDRTLMIGEKALTLRNIDLFDYFDDRVCLGLIFNPEIIGITPQIVVKAFEDRGFGDIMMMIGVGDQRLMIWSNLVTMPIIVQILLRLKISTILLASTSRLTFEKSQKPCSPRRSSTLFLEGSRPPSPRTPKPHPFPLWSCTSLLPGIFQTLPWISRWRPWVPAVCSFLAR